MSMTQRYAGMLRRQAANWDKQGMPVQAECCRQAARHMETREPAGVAAGRTAVRDAARSAAGRLRDFGKPCICCGQSTVGQDVDAGHFLSVGSSPDMRRFDPDNIHLQLQGCNRGRTQPPRERFRAHMIERIGLERVLRLEGPWPVVKWTREGLAELRQRFLAMARELKV